MVKLLLEMFAVPYVPVDCLPMQERTRLVERVLSLADVKPVVGSKTYLTSPGLSIAVDSRSERLSSRDLTPVSSTRLSNGHTNGAHKEKEPAKSGH